MALFDMQVDEVFTIEEGLKAILEGISRNQKIELINLPVALLRKWKPQLMGKNAVLYNNLEQGLPADLQEIGREVFTSVQMKGTLYGQVVEKGEVFLKNRIFNIWYAGDEILHIGSITYRRCVTCIQAMHREIMLQDHMDELNIMTLYDAETGVEAILEAIAVSARVRMVNLPKSLVRKIVVYFDTEDIKILCAQKGDQAKKMADDYGARVTGGLLNVYSKYKGRKVKSGGIALDAKFFSVNYLDEEIYMVLGLEWPRCPTCMTDFYELGWRVSGKIR